MTSVSVCEHWTSCASPPHPTKVRQALCMHVVSECPFWCKERWAARGQRLVGAPAMASSNGQHAQCQNQKECLSACPVCYSPEACMGVSKGTRSFSLDVIAVTSKLSLMSRHSMACKGDSDSSVSQTWHRNSSATADKHDTCWHVGTETESWLWVSASRIREKHLQIGPGDAERLQLFSILPQNTCADEAALQADFWTDSRFAAAHHWTGRRSEQRPDAWSPSSQTGPAKHNYMLFLP